MPHWLKQMDFTYRERPVFTKGWKSSEGLLPSDYWKRNMFVEFMEDDLGVQLRDAIGVDNMLWGSDFPHAESTWPKSRRVPGAHLRRRARGGSAQDHLGERRADVRLLAELTRGPDSRGVRDGFVPVPRVSELAPGTMKWVAVDRERVLVANVDGAFYAIPDVCGHRQAPLSKGTL